jgi:hypothetical protein
LNECDSREALSGDSQSERQRYFNWDATSLSPVNQGFFRIGRGSGRFRDGEGKDESGFLQGDFDTGLVKSSFLNQQP